MSMTDLQEALSLVASCSSKGFFVGPRDTRLIAKAEMALGGGFPPSYREFIARLGAGNFGAFEVYGVINDEFEKSSVPNAVWLTLQERRESGLPDDLVIIGNTGYGDYYCVGLGKEGENPVILFHPGLPKGRQRGERVASDFGAFFLDGVGSQFPSN